MAVEHSCATQTASAAADQIAHGYAGTRGTARARVDGRTRARRPHAAGRTRRWSRPTRDRVGGRARLGLFPGFATLLASAAAASVG
jgi:hypothetical protein